MAAVLVAAACSSAPEAFEAEAPKATGIKALRWMAPGADKIRALTTRPAACERLNGPFEPAPDGPLSVTRRDIGRLAFESPALLGGAAARMGLSCSSCHLNGRDNPDFFVKGVSGAPGTADVTSSLFSKVRGDGTFNPAPIPDLAARDGKQIRDRKSAAFREKVHGLVVEEFDGQEPPPYLFEALLDYLDSLDISECSNPAERRPVTASVDIGAASLALNAAVDLLQQQKVEDALMMTRIARHALELAHERYIASDQRPIRERLIAASRAIQQWAESVRIGDRPPAPTDLVDGLGSFIYSQPTGHQSLYNPDILRAALAN
jgi:hypothetical protein